MLNLGSGEIFLILILAVVILGPSKLPEYAASLARLVRTLRDMAEGAKTQIKEEMGPAFDDVNWDQLDPRQYDPRRIVREALATPSDKTKTTAELAGMGSVDPPGGAPSRRKASASAGPDDGDLGEPTPKKALRPAAVRRPRQRFDPDLPTPFDVDAT
ncbi:MAG: twin-arginine translocase TatA/TatE family subunit [Ornithinimicrobium sp.]